MTIVAKVMLLVVLVNFICHSFVVRSWTLQRTSVWSIIRPKACTKTSHLHSTKLRWEQIPPYQEPNEDLDEDGSPKLSVLTGGHSAEKIDVDSLVQQWIDQCNADGRPNDVDKFTLQTAIPLVTKKNKFVELVNATLDLAQLRDKSITFISEEELKKLWVDGSFKAMGKPASSYSVQDALLLMDDGDSVDTWGAPEGEVVLDDKTELIVTQQVHTYVYHRHAFLYFMCEVPHRPYEIVHCKPLSCNTVGIYVWFMQELERVWASRSEISWGMPSRQFDQQAALLLLDADEDDEEVLDEVEILTRGVVEGVAGEVSSTAVGGGEGSEISAGSDSVYVGCSAMLSEGEEYISGHEAALLPPDNSVSERMVRIRYIWKIAQSSSV